MMMVMEKTETATTTVAQRGSEITDRSDQIIPALAVRAPILK